MERLNEILKTGMYMLYDTHYGCVDYRLLSKTAFAEFESEVELRYICTDIKKRINIYEICSGGLCVDSVGVQM